MKSKVLILAGFYSTSQRTSGALRTINNMILELTPYYDFHIFAPFRNMKNQDNKEDIFRIPTRTEERLVTYTTSTSELFRQINNYNFDIYYLNSFLDKEFSIKIIIGIFLGLLPDRPIILAPRGELMEGALSVKRYKKIFFLFLAKFSGLYNHVIWQASSSYEANVIKSRFKKKLNIRIALDIPDYRMLEIKSNYKHKVKNRLKILFLSVINPNKNLSFVIDILNKVQGEFYLDIYGPIKDKKYFDLCMRKVNMNYRNRIVYNGEVTSDSIHRIYPQYDLLFFPTKGENFGHVIYESLACGCPVLTSDRVIWKELNKFGAGWNFSLNTPNLFIEVLEKLINQGETEYFTFSTNCRKYLEAKIDREKILKENIELFKEEKTRAKIIRNMNI